MKRTLQRRAAFGAFIALCLTGSAANLRADPLTFNGTYFLIDSLPTRLDLFTNPGVVITPRTYGGTLPTSFVFSTFVDFAGGESVSDIVRFTYQEAGRAPLVTSHPFTTGTEPVQFGFPTLFEPISHTGRPVATTLTVDLVNSSPDFMIPGGPNQGRLVNSYTYSFFTLTPTPEPSTLLLLGTGAAFALRRRLRNSRATSEPV